MPAHGKCVAQSPDSFLFWQEAIHVQLCLAFLEKNNGIDSEIKSALSQPVWKKKIPETMEGLYGIFLLYTDAEVSLTDPLASGETQRNDLGS